MDNMWGNYPENFTPKMYWGARAIIEKDGALVLMPDRQSFQQLETCHKSKDEFMAWLNETVLPELGKKAREGFFKNWEDTFVLDSSNGDFHCEATPKNSYGSYLYIGAWEVEEAALVSLNEVYQKEDRMFYFCNAVAEINVKGKGPLYCGQPEELPLLARDLYENFWAGNNASHTEYVVELDGETGFCFCFLASECWLSDIKKDYGFPELTMDDMLDAIKSIGNRLASDDFLKGCKILVGEDTDPDGHELLVYVPYWYRNRIQDIRQYLDAKETGVFDSIETAATAIQGEVQKQERKTDYPLLLKQKLELERRLMTDADDPLWGIVNFLDFVLDEAEERGEFKHPMDETEADEQ